MSTGAEYQLERVGIFRPKQEMLPELGPGEVGFFTAAIKQVSDMRVGDTVTDAKNPVSEPLPGFKPVQQVVFCGLFPVDAAQFEDLREAHGPPAPQRCELLLRDGKFGCARPSDSVAASSACCISKSSRNASSASSISTSSPLRRASSTDFQERRHDGGDAQSGGYAGSRVHRPHRGALDRGDHPCSRRASGLGAKTLPGPSRPARRPSLTSARAPWPSTSYRSTKWCSISTTA